MKKRPFIIPIVFVISAGMIAIMLMKPPFQVQLTEFYVLSTREDTQDYPRGVRVGDDIPISIGIGNHEGATIDYRIEIRSNGALLVQVDPLVIKDKSLWEGTLRFVLKQEGDDQRIDVLLFEKNDSRPYRQLHFFVDVRPRL